MANKISILNNNNLGPRTLNDQFNHFVLKGINTLCYKLSNIDSWDIISSPRHSYLKFKPCDRPHLIGAFWSLLKTYLPADYRLAGENNPKFSPQDLFPESPVKINTIYLLNPELIKKVISPNHRTLAVMRAKNFITKLSLDGFLEDKELTDSINRAKQAVNKIKHNEVLQFANVIEYLKRIRDALIKEILPPPENLARRHALAETIKTEYLDKYAKKEEQYLLAAKQLNLKDPQVVAESKKEKTPNLNG